MGANEALGGKRLRTLLVGLAWLRLCLELCAYFKTPQIEVQSGPVCAVSFYAINVAITDQWRGEFRVDLLHATVASSGFVTAAAVCDSEFFWIYKSINVATTKQSMARINQSWSR